MNNIIYRIVVSVIICSCITGMLTGCGKETIDPDKYSSYICYDYHLKCLEVEKERARIDFSYKSDLTGGEFTEMAWIQRIDGESDDMFIYAEVPSFPLGPSEKVVMQNPDNYVDIRGTWSIEKIELYYIDLHKPIFQDKSANIPTAVIATTYEDKCLSDIKELVGAIDKWEKPNIPDGYVREFIDENGSGSRYYIRVYFKESENIVWDSEIQFYYSSENKDRIMYIDIGKEPDRIASDKHMDMNISNYTNLVNWIITAISN